MTKKFTEEEYQKIADIADRYFYHHKELAVTYNLKSICDYISYNKIVESKKIKDLKQELVLIALPKSRDWAYEHYVEKEKKYFWTGKTTDKDGRYVHISRDDKNKPKIIRSRECNPIGYPFTETEVKAAYLDVDMFEKEEVE